MRPCVPDNAPKRNESFLPTPPSPHYFSNDFCLHNAENWARSFYSAQDSNEEILDATSSDIIYEGKVPPLRVTSRVHPKLSRVNNLFIKSCYVKHTSLKIPKHFYPPSNLFFLGHGRLQAYNSREKVFIPV